MGKSVEKIKLVYIAGYGRSGTTVLDNILAQIPGFTTVGELRYLWSRGFEQNRFCGCRKRFLECQFWNNVIKTSHLDDNDKIKKMSDGFESLSSQQIKLVFSNNPYDFKESISILDSLYKRIVEVSKCKVIIDSSKWPTYAKLLSFLPSRELYIVDMIRDPRAVAFSWNKTKNYEPFKNQDKKIMLIKSSDAIRNKLSALKTANNQADTKRVGGVYIDKRGVIRTSVEWILYNIITSYIFRKIQVKKILVRYEDMAQKPEKTVTAILDFIEEKESNNPLKGNVIKLGKNHCIAGNPVRFKRGKVKIKLDDEWKLNMSLRDKFISTVLTLPYLIYYGYPLKSR